MLAEDEFPCLVEFSMMPHRIVIAGAGFSGTVLAANLLRLPLSGPTDIVLVERGPAMGPGVAYADREFPYLLNVPAVRLSADSKDPSQFLRFAQALDPDIDGEDFLPRALYGDYLQDVLLQAERAAPHSTRLLRVFDEVRDITERGPERPFAVEFAGRRPIDADRVVLALGNPLPRLMPWAAAVGGHRAYRPDPWDLPKTLAADTAGIDRRQWIDDGGRGRGVESGRCSCALAAYDVTARLDSPGADGLPSHRGAGGRGRHCWRV